MDNEFLLTDRIQKIKQVITKYGVENFAISYSGGKDSVALSNLIDMALPDNNIPRVYINTGIDYKMIIDFVKDQANKDNRIVIIEPACNIKDTLSKYGYPFKSKEHSAYVKTYKRNGFSKTVMRYLFPDEKRKAYGCIDKLKYQFTPEFNLNISDACCLHLKEKPLYKWLKENNKKHYIIGLVAGEHGRRNNAKCLTFVNGEFKNFQPLMGVNKAWVEWFINSYNIDICDIYKTPYNFKRTGCKGCPFNIYLQRDLDIMEKYFPNERKQCETIWKPVYDEYRRINYRLKG